MTSRNFLGELVRRVIVQGSGLLRGGVVQRVLPSVWGVYR